MARLPNRLGEPFFVPIHLHTRKQTARGEEGGRIVAGSATLVSDVRCLHRYFSVKSLSMMMGIPSIRLAYHGSFAVPLGIAWGWSPACFAAHRYFHTKSSPLMPRHQTSQRNPRQRLARDDQHGLAAVPDCQTLPRDRVGRGRGDRSITARWHCAARPSTCPAHPSASPRRGSEAPPGSA